VVWTIDGQSRTDFHRRELDERATMLAMSIAVPTDT
jgi:hypothetical protein